MLELLICCVLAFQDLDTQPKKPADASAASQQDPDSRSDKAKSGDEVAAATPEEALRTFMLALITQDEATLRAVTVPLDPPDDFDWLLRGSPPLTAEQLEQVKERLKQWSIKTLKPGDEVTLPGGRKLKVRDDEVTDTRAVLLPEGAPIPHRMQKIDGRWRVDARPVVVGRKAADAARKRKEAEERK